MSLRGSPKRDALAIDPSGSVPGSAAGGRQEPKRIQQVCCAKRAEGVAQRNGALPMRWRLTGALRERIPRSVLEKLASYAPWLEFRCDFEDGAPYEWVQGPREGLTI